MAHKGIANPLDTSINSRRIAPEPALLARRFETDAVPYGKVEFGPCPR